MADSSNEHGQPVPAQPVLDYASSRTDLKARAAMPGVLRFAGVYAGVLVPAVCLLWSIAGYPGGPDWQSGRLGDYAKLFLSARSGWPFFPLLVYSMYGMLLVCGSPRPAWYARRFAVRFAVYTGVVLAAQFTVIMFLSVALDGPKVAVQALIGGLAGTAVPAAGLMLFDFLARRYGADTVFLVCVMIACGVALVALGFGGGTLGAVVGFPVFGSLFLATPWALAVYTTVAVRVYRLARDEPTGPGAIAAPVWGVTYAGAWAVAVEQAIRTYHALPTVAPSRCYVASAAARGHRRFVRSQIVAGIPVNDQLRRLKCAEIALATVAPFLHRALRRVYDRVGPVLAAGMIHPLLADLAYTMLKPAEWAGTWVMRRLIDDFDELAAGLYSESGDSASRRD
jgi:hypothetical protein